MTTPWDLLKHQTDKKRVREFDEISMFSPNTVLKDFYDFFGQEWLKESLKKAHEERSISFKEIKEKYFIKDNEVTKPFVFDKNDNKTALLNIDSEISDLLDVSAENLILLNNNEYGAFVAKDIKESILEKKLLKTVKVKSSDELINENKLVSKILKELIEFSKENDVSDIHFEPKSETYDVRVKINGRLVLWNSFSSDHEAIITKRIKKTFGLKANIGNEVQDGSGILDTYSLGFRASLIPTLYGESVVLRLIDMNFNPILENLGFSKDAYQGLREVDKVESGLILLSGPTGSGKSTTIYGLLKHIAKKHQKTVSVEDPIERRVNEISQFQVDERNTFSKLIRGILRHDPDNIFIGEIRDKESLKIAIQAAQTGHLVLSTVHANSSKDVIPRMVELGVEEGLILNVLRASYAQRLSAVVCDECRGLGCNQCQRTGVVKRIPVIEATFFEDGKVKSSFSDKNYGKKYVEEAR